MGAYSAIGSQPHLTFAADVTQSCVLVLFGTVDKYLTIVGWIVSFVP